MQEYTNSRLFKYDGSARYQLVSFSRLTRCDQELESAVGCTCFNLFRFDLSVTDRRSWQKAGRRTPTSIQHQTRSKKSHGQKYNILSPDPMFTNISCKIGIFGFSQSPTLVFLNCLKYTPPCFVYVLAIWPLARGELSLARCPSTTPEMVCATYGASRLTS